MIAKCADTGAAAQLFEAEREDLVAIVAQHAFGDLLGGGRQTSIALDCGEFAARDDRREQNLQVDLVVGHIDAGGIVDGVVVDAPAAQRELDARALA